MNGDPVTYDDENYLQPARRHAPSGGYRDEDYLRPIRLRYGDGGDGASGYDEPVVVDHDEDAYAGDPYEGDAYGDGAYGDVAGGEAHEAEPYDYYDYDYEEEPAPVLPSRRRRSRRDGARGHGHRVLAVLGIVVVVLILASGVLAWWARDQISPGGKPGPVVGVVIPAGSSTARIGSILASRGIIHSSTLFHIYVKLQGTGTLYPGHYHLAKNESYSQAIAALEQGPPIIQDRLVIPEGFTVDQMAVAVSQLPHAHISAAQFVKAATSGAVRSPYEPAATNNLEGLLFPATYEVRQGETATDLVQQMVDAFDANANVAGLAAGAAKLGLTPYQVVTVASMVEREAKRPQDRGPIASVIYNRLKSGMYLGIDATLLYGLHTTNPNVNPETPNPYNTRLHLGLPPTPISNPGLASLEAASHPPVTNYLFYAVTGSGGATSFASTSAGFAQIEAKCRQAGYCS